MGRKLGFRRAVVTAEGERKRVRGRRWRGGGDGGEVCYFERGCREVFCERSWRGRLGVEL